LTDAAAYEDKVAAFFGSLGYDAKVRHSVQGARAEHKIDVWVTFEIHGRKQRWVVECKYWKKNVDKEKVLALRSVVEDVGGTMGFIITETGFQPAALSATQLTNLELLTFAELMEGARRATSDPLCRPFATLRLAAGERIPIVLTGPHGQETIVEAVPQLDWEQCVMPPRIAEGLGLEIAQGAPLTPGGPGVLRTEVDVRIESAYAGHYYSWRAPFAVSRTVEGAGVPFVVLGRRGFFDRFAVHLIV
jgi:hypothetical protein